MPPLFPIGLLWMAVAIALSFFLRRADRLARERATSSARATLEETGLSLSGDPLSTFTLRGRFSSVDVVLDSASIETPPGPSADASVVCMVRVSASISDLVVCRASEIDRTMGPLPAAPRVRTGHAEFDQRYAVFVSRGETEYRGVEPANVGPWAAPATLERMMELGLEWMRVRDRNAEIALARMSADDATRGLAVAANVVRVTRGEPLVDVRPGPLTPRPALPDSSVAVWWMVAGAIGALGGFLVSFHDWFLAIDQRAVCGAGATLLVTENDGADGGTEYGFHCSNGHDTYLIGIHVLSCMLIGVGLFAIILLGSAAMRRRSRLVE